MLQWIARNIPAQTALYWLSAICMVAAILLAIRWWPKRTPAAVRAVRARPRPMDEPPTYEEPVRIIAIVEAPAPARMAITRALPAASPKPEPPADPWHGADENWSPMEEQKLCAAELPAVELMGGAEQVQVVHDALWRIEESAVVFRANIDAIIDSLCRDQPEIRLRVCTSGEKTGQWDLRELRAELATASR